MNSSYFTSPERLEQRIAPAGLVTVSFQKGLLTINGADGADHDVDIVKTGIDTFRVDGAGTDINQLGVMSKTFQGKLKQVLIEGGAGADTFEIVKLRPLKSLSFMGDAGVHSLTTTNLRTVPGGRVDIDLGAETGAVNFSGSKTAIHGKLNINLGGGGTATFGSALTAVDGSVAITGGPGSDLVSITGDDTLFRRTFAFTGGDGNDSFTATGKSLKVKGLVTMDGGAGSNQFVFAADTHKIGNNLTPGLVDLKLGVGPGTVTFLGESTKVLGDLKIVLGAGGGTVQLGSAVTSIRNHVQVTGGIGNDTLAFDGQTSIGKSLSFLGDAGDDRLLATGDLLAVQSATSMDGGTGASIFDVNVGNLALAGLAVTGGTSNDRVSIIADGTIAGDANLQLGLDGTGPSSVILQSRAGIVDGLKFGGSLTIDMRGATVDFLTIANIRVAKAFDAQTGDNVSTVNISRLNAISNFKLQTGAGADVVNIDNISAVDFYVDTQVGADELRIERNASHIGASQVLGIATILTGIGADQIRIGNASDPANLKVSFMGAVTLDAGDGANMRNDVQGSNSFASAPTIVATGGTLTQTEAV